MPFHGFVGKHTRGTDFHQIAAELAFQNALALATKIDMIMAAENIEIPAAGIVAVKAHTAVTLNAAVHLMIDEWTEILVAMGPFFEAIFPMMMAGHDRHVLQMAFTAFVADRAVMGMVDHQPFGSHRL